MRRRSKGMKPVNLKIKGLNSFVEEQTIQFSKLTEKGLFGIFGPTASGKSTILDGITIALYGKVSRDTKEFVNTETNVVEISYDFEIGLGKARKLYRAERCIKRLKTGYFKTAYARLIDVNRENPEGSVVLAEGPKDVEENIVDIIGLKVEDFTRSVVLPQGKFNEFLKLTGKDRRSMLERIFALEKYGSKLYEKIRAMKTANLITKNELEGEMKGFENVDEEAKAKIVDKLLSLNSEEKAFKLQKAYMDKEYEECKSLWDLQSEKNKYQKRVEQLKLQEDEIKSKTEKFTKGTSALNVKPFIDYVDETSKSLSINKTLLEKLNIDFKITSEKLQQTKISYEAASLDKNNKLPILIESEANLKQASVIEEKIVKLASDRSELLNKYKGITSNIKEYTSNYDILQTNKAKIEAAIGKSEEDLSKIEIKPEYREKLQNAYNSELEVIAIEKNVESLKNKEKAYQKEIETTTLKNSEAMVLHDIKCEQLADFEEKATKLANNFPGDNNLLLEKQATFSALHDTLEKAVENHKLEAELKEKSNNASIECAKHKINLKNLGEIIETRKAHLKTIENNIKVAQHGSMAAILACDLSEGAPCLVCGSLEHPRIAEMVASSEIAKMEGLKEEEKLNLEKLSNDFQKEQISVAEFSRDEDNIKASLSKTHEKLVGLNIEELKSQEKDCNITLQRFKKDLEDYNIEKAKLDLSLIKARDEKNKIDVTLAMHSESLKKETGSKTGVEEELSIILDSLKNAQKKHQLLIEELLIEENLHLEDQSDNTIDKTVSIKEKIQLARDADKEVLKLTLSSRKLRSELVALEKQRSDVDKILKELTTTKTEIETSGKEKRAEIERLTLQIIDLCGFTPENKRTSKTEIEIVRSQIKEVTVKEATLRAVLESENIELQKVQTQKVSEENKSEMLINLLAQGHEKLKASLNENFFEDAETASSHLITRQNLMLIQKEITDYEELLRSVTYNLKRVDLLLDGKEVDPVQFEELKVKREDLQKLIEEKTKDIGAFNRSLQDMEKKLEQIKELLVKKKGVEHKLSLLKELDTLIQGNKFVEYVAMKQLKYISLEASKRLKEITRGRYALELDSDGAFIMRDDFNGGRRRETNTLSGGETFLTSLCLALALSSQIQLKGSAPLEFFFLDEGFGSLDRELVDLVMNSLEKLHSDTLSVGIISHVEELRSRVPVKLIVTPAEQGQGGSKVKLEYT
jgi:exonuclease SbcC